ncbi:MAG: LPS export ABC transporter periplasmic protein LptC [Candidatus Bipolaricaulota bacterium]|nr:LPS export ABC transporter periplasmic protein LptC [Candidatus Bipolaricaulota bacterium]
MSRTTKILLLAAGVLSGAVALFLTFTRPSILSPSAAAEAIDVVMRGYSAAGDPTWEMRAARGEIVEREGTLVDVAVDLFQRGKEPIRVSADRLVREGQTALLEGGVRIERDDGLEIETDAVTWREDAETLESGETKLSYEDGELQADRFDYDLRTRRGKLSGVAVTLNREDELRVVSERAELAEDALTLEGSVHAESAEGTLEAERLTATLDGDSIALSGGVAAEGEGFSASADAADVREDGWILRGNVLVDADLSKLGGERGS